MKGMPILTWWATQGCTKDLIFLVKSKIEAKKIHATIPLKLAACHTGIFSISLFFLLPLESNYKAGQQEKEKIQTLDL